MMHRFEQSHAYFSHESTAWKVFVTIRYDSKYRRRGLPYALGEYAFTKDPCDITKMEIESFFESKIKLSKEWLEPIVTYYQENS